MNGISGYLLSVIGVVLISAVLTTLIPNGRTSNLIKTLTRLACILIIIAPIPAFLKGEKDNVSVFGDFFQDSVIETDESFIDYYRQLRVQNAEDQLENELLEKYDVTCAVKLTWQENDDNGDIQITLIYVKTEKQIAKEVVRDMCEYVSKNYCSEVLIE